MFAFFTSAKQWTGESNDFSKILSVPFPLPVSCMTASFIFLMTPF